MPGAVLTCGLTGLGATALRPSGQPHPTRPLLPGQGCFGWAQHPAGNGEPGWLSGPPPPPPQGPQRPRVGRVGSVSRPEASLLIRGSKAGRASRAGTSEIPSEMPFPLDPPDVLPPRPRVPCPSSPSIYGDMLECQLLILLSQTPAPPHPRLARTGWQAGAVPIRISAPVKLALNWVAA